MCVSLFELGQGFKVSLYRKLTLTVCGHLGFKCTVCNQDGHVVQLALDLDDLTEKKNKETKKKRSIVFRRVGLYLTSCTSSDNRDK